MWYVCVCVCVCLLKVGGGGGEVVLHLQERFLLVPRLRLVVGHELVHEFDVVLDQLQVVKTTLHALHSLVILQCERERGIILIPLSHIECLLHIYTV